MKQCVRCKTVKNFNAFSKDKKRKDGLNPYCRKCRKELSSIRQEKLRSRDNISIPEDKLCPKCEMIKPIKEFHKNKNYASGVASYCKNCKKKYQSSTGYRKLARKSVQKQWQENPRLQTIRMRLASAKRRAKKLKLEFNLDLAWIEKQLDNQGNKCAITGVPFDYSKSNGTSRPDALSVDRINSRLGYVKNNVQLVTWIYNQAKSSFGEYSVLHYLINPIRNKLGIQKLTEEQFYDKIGKKPE